MVDYRAAAVELAQKYGLDPNLFVRQIQQESGFNPEARSPAGAVGLAQLMPGTALDMGVMRIDPMQNLEGGAKYMRMLLDRYSGDYPKALAAYNAGMGNVDKYGGIPPFKETQNYVSIIFGSAPMATQPGNTQQGGPAVDQYAQPPQQKGILSYLTDPEKRAKLGLVLSSLASTPNAGVQQMLTNKIAGFEDARTANKTAQWLASKGRDDLAQAVAGGMLSAKDAVAMAMEAPTATSGVTVGNNIVNPITGEIIYKGPDAETTSPAEFRSLDLQARAAGFLPKSEGGDGQYENFMATAGAGLRAGAVETAKTEAATAAAAPGQNALYDTLEFQVNDLLNDPYLPNMLGPAKSRLPNISGEAARVQSKMDQISGGAFLQARQLLKGGGAITDFESKKAETAFLRMNAAQNEPDFRKAMQDFLDATKSGLPKLQAAAPSAGSIAPAPSTGGPTLTYNPATGEFE